MKFNFLRKIHSNSSKKQNNDSKEKQKKTSLFEIGINFSFSSHICLLKSTKRYVIRFLFEFEKHTFEFISFSFISLRCLLLENDIKILREKNNIEVKAVGQSYQIVAGDKVKLEQVISANTEN